MINQQTCPICLSDDDILSELPCKHSFCRECLNTQIEELIKNKIESKLCCATCNQEFDIVKIQDIIDKDIFNLYNSTLIKIGEVECSNQYEKFIQCDYQGCNGSFIINQGIQKIICPLCGKELCHKCYKQQHPNYTCEQAKDMKDQDNQTFVQDAKKMGYAQCPQCKIMVEKVKGCNFMYCLNKKCHSYFCYQCGQLLNKSQHYSHYEQRDPFKGACVQQIQQSNVPIQNNNYILDLLLNQGNFEQFIQQYQNNPGYLLQMKNKYAQNKNAQAAYQQLLENNNQHYEELRKQQQEIERLEVQRRQQEQQRQRDIEQQEQEKLQQEKLQQEKLEKYTCSCGNVFNSYKHISNFDRCFKCNKKIFCHTCITFFDSSQLIFHQCVK